MGSTAGGHGAPSSSLKGCPTSNCTYSTFGALQLCRGVEPSLYLYLSAESHLCLAAHQQSPHQQCCRGGFGVPSGISHLHSPHLHRAPEAGRAPLLQPCSSGDSPKAACQEHTLMEWISKDGHPSPLWVLCHCSAPHTAKENSLGTGDPSVLLSVPTTVPGSTHLLLSKALPLTSNQKPPGLLSKSSLSPLYPPLGLT